MNNVTEILAVAIGFINTQAKPTAKISSFAADFLATCQPADYYGVTVGMNWKPAKLLKIDWKPMQKLNIRPNIHYDRVEGIGQEYRPFDNRKDPLRISVDATIRF